ncbi:MAG TPA: sugar phosphate isomerase/epimerase family protein [Pirellulales bacterium]
MAQLSINEVTTFRWPFERDLAEYAALGIGAVGVWRQKLSDFGEEKGIELLAESGLKVSNLLWAGGFTGSDGGSLRENIDDGLEAVRLAHEMNAACLVVYSGGRAGHTHNHVRRLVKEAMNELARSAAELDVTLALEPMHLGCAAEWTFLTSLDAALELIDCLDAPHIKLAFDTYHFGGDDGILTRLAGLAPRIAIVHLGDRKCPPQHEQNRVRLGEGTLPLGEIVAALNSAGYTGYYDVELLGEEFETADYRELIEHSKRAFERWLG